MEKRKKYLDRIIELIPVTMLWMVIIAMAAVMFCGMAEGSPRYPANLWKGLLGEAIGDGPEGMTAVCHVYKNRLNKGMRLGCVALKRKSLNKFIAEQLAYGRRIGRDYKKEAKNIINKVFRGESKDPTGGALFYENIEIFGVPYWAKDMVVTTKLKSHTFYKRR